MADVTLAETGSQVWLVGGEEYIDDLLGNTLSPATTIEIVACRTQAETWALWEEKSGKPEDGAMPWLIHPNIIRRIKGGLDEQTIRFTPWSAMVTEAAEAVIGAAANWLSDHPAGRVTLGQFAPAAMPPGLADLQRLRAQLVLAALTRMGGDASRVEPETRPSEAAADIERLDLVPVTQAAITTG